MVAADGVAALVMTATVLGGALIDVCRKKAHSSQERVGADRVTWLFEDDHVRF